MWRRRVLRRERSRVQPENKDKIIRRDALIYLQLSLNGCTTRPKGGDPQLSFASLVLASLSFSSQTSCRFAIRLIPSLSLFHPLPSPSQTLLSTDSLRTPILFPPSNHGPSQNDPALSLNPLKQPPWSNPLRSQTEGRDLTRMAPNMMIVLSIAGMFSCSRSFTYT